MGHAAKLLIGGAAAAAALGGILLSSATGQSASLSQQSETSTDLSAIMSAVLAANKSGNAQRILATFAPAERPGLTKLVSDPAILAANSAIHAKIVSATVQGVRPYRGYKIVTVAEQLHDGKTRLKNYPLKQTAEGWLLTNDLASDDGFKPYE
jgi:hypothetical protein